VQLYLNGDYDKLLHKDSQKKEQDIEDDDDPKDVIDLIYANQRR
jgi:hypothetical protein